VLRPAPSPARLRPTAALLLAGLLGTPARAHGPALLVPAPGIVTECREDVRLFDSLSSGTVDYCRRHLRYVPGALDCYQVIDRVCWVFVPAIAEWTDTYSPRTRIAFPCPDGPVPPVCRRLDVQ
jgi:hypothetical protein